MWTTGTELATPAESVATVARYFANCYRDRCWQKSQRVVNYAALAKGLKDAEYDGASLEDLRGAVDSFCILVKSGMIDVKLKVPWRVFLKHLPALVSNRQQRPVDPGLKSGLQRRVLTPEDKAALLAKHAGVLQA